MIMMAYADTLGDYKATVSSCTGNAFAITITGVMGKKLITPFKP
jgi:hypothetical protein